MSLSPSKQSHTEMFFESEAAETSLNHKEVIAVTSNVLSVCDDLSTSFKKRGYRFPLDLKHTMKSKDTKKRNEKVCNTCVRSRDTDNNRQKRGFEF